ncbi:MAG TPA: hypothetical protein VIN06_18050, partial [Devosia sp.]
MTASALEDRVSHLDQDLSTVLVAQAEGQQATPPAADAPAATDPVRTVIELADGPTLTLPAGASIDAPRVNGTDLEFVQPDGSIIVVPNGAVTGLTIVVGDATIAAETVALLFETNNIETAAGPEAGPQGLPSSGGNFATPVPGIGDGPAMNTLLDPTDFGLPGTDLDELIDGATVTVAAVNGPPETDDTSASGDEDAASIQVNLTGSDIDGTVAEFRIESLPLHGKLYAD